jgi:hypothetical protein
VGLVDEERGTTTHPLEPSLDTTLERPVKVDRKSGGSVVCMRTLTASKGHRATSAMSSADALAVRYSEVFHWLAFSSPTRSL